MIKDTLVEGDETVGLTLSNPGGAVLGGRSAAELKIVDDDATPTLQFSAPTYKVSESMPRATITVKRTGNLARAVTVEYAITGGTATNGGVDYDLPATGTLTFGARVATQTILVPLVNDALDEGTETVLLALQNPQDVLDPGVSPVNLGATGATELDITDNEPTVQFSTATYKASEAAKSMIVTVKRAGDLTGTAIVSYDVTGGTATRDTGSGGDYSITAPGTLTFAPKQSLQKIPIVLNPDTVSEGSETIELALSAPDRRRARHAQRDRRDDQGQRQGRQGPVQRHRLQRGRERRPRDHHRHPAGRYRRARPRSNTRPRTAPRSPGRTTPPPAAPSPSA